MTGVYQERLREAAARIPEGIEVQQQVVSRGAAHSLIQKAAERVDLLCVGSRGYGPLRRVLLGSFSAPLVKHCPAPMLVVPRGARETETGEASATAAGQAK